MIRQLMAKLKVVHKWVELGRVKSFMLILGRVTSLVGRVWSGQKNGPRTRLGDRSFDVAGPRLWNKLPASLRSSDSLCQFSGA